MNEQVSSKAESKIQTLTFCTLLPCCYALYGNLLLWCHVQQRVSMMCGAEDVEWCCSAYGGYVVGLGTTIIVMNIFEAAQPALLYIVPAVLAAVLGHAAINKQFLEVSVSCFSCSCAFSHTFLCIAQQGIRPACVDLLAVHIAPSGEVWAARLWQPHCCCSAACLSAT